jgi:hypothetical protein
MPQLAGSQWTVLFDGCPSQTMHYSASAASIRGQIPPHLLESIRRGADIEGVHYKGLDINVLQGSPRRSSLRVDIDANKVIFQPKVFNQDGFLR